MCSCRSHKSVWNQPRFNKKKKSILFMMSTCNRKQKQQCLRLVEVTVTIEMSKSVNVRLVIENRTSETMGAEIAVRRSKVYWSHTDNYATLYYTSQTKTTVMENNNHHFEKVGCSLLWNLEFAILCGMNCYSIQFNSVYLYCTKSQHSCLDALYSVR